MLDHNSSSTDHLARFRRILGLCSVAGLLLGLSACSGLSSEPKIISTLVPETPQPPTATVVTSSATQPATVQAAASTQQANSAPGSVSGNVTNGTAGAIIPPNLAVTLHSAAEDGAETTFNATTDAAGNFTFKDVPIQADRFYWVTTVYANRDFRTEFTPGTLPSMTLPLKVYDVTGSADVISISGMTIRVMVAADGLQVAQITRFKNKSDRMYSTDTSNGKGGYNSVSVALPRGAQIMGFSDDEQRYTISADNATITDSAAVLPGEDHVIHVIYTMPYRDGMSIEQPIAYPLDGNVQLLVSPESINANTQQLPTIGLQVQDNGSLHAYGGPLTLAAGSSLRYQLTGSIPTTSSATAATTQSVGFSRELIVGLLIGLGIGTIGLGLLMLGRDRFVAARGQNDSRKERIDSLVGQLARLDDEHANGALGKSAYAKRRRRLKLQLTKLMEE